MGRATAMLAALLIATVLPGWAPAAADDDPNAYTTTQFYIAMKDGTKLHAVLSRPANIGERTTPVIMSPTPYMNSGGDFSNPQPFGEGRVGPPSWLTDPGRTFERGYSHLWVSLPGFGASSGCYDPSGPRERAAVKTAVEWAASQPWSNGKVGFFTGSYPGGSVLTALASKPRGLAAMMLMSPFSGYRVSYTHGVANTLYGRAFLPGWSLFDLWPVSLNAPTEHVVTAAVGDATTPVCFAEVSAGNLSNDPNDPFWQQRDVLALGAGSDVPIMWVQGFRDWLAKPSNILPLLGTFAGPTEVLLGPWGHGFDLKPSYAPEIMDFYDRYLLDNRDAPLRPRVRVQDQQGRFRAENAWPPSDTVRSAVPLHAGSYTDAPGNAGETAWPDGFPFMGGSSTEPLTTGAGAWTLTQPLPYDMHLSGAPKLTVDVTSLVPNVHLVPFAYDVDPDGRSTLVSRGAFLVPMSGRYTFDMFPNDWTFPSGHRIGILLSGSDDPWFESGVSHTPVRVTGGSLEIGFLENARTNFLPDGPYGVSWTPPEPFIVSEDTIEANTVDAPLPPPMR